MKTLLSISFILFTSLLYAQFDGPLTESQPEKKKNAAPVCRAPQYRMIADCDGTVYSEKINVNGREEDIVFHSRSGKPYTGQCKVCHNNGNLWMFLSYNNGRSKGIDTVWYENGNINLIRAHDTTGLGTEHGMWKFYRENGSLKWEKNYVNGMADGEQRHYFEDSTLHKIEVWKMDQLNGKKQEFYRGGQLKKEVNYKNGKWNGTYITYFEDGKVESEQVYSNDKKEGPSTYYYESGNISYTENHVNGKKEGTFKKMYRSGKKFTIENYKNDMRHGEFEEFYDNEKNTIKYTAIYKKGVVQEEHYFDEFEDEILPPEKKENNADGESEEGGKKKKKKKGKKGEGE
ncbi:MAG: toxin-antitoxin system YwqK family antitoxin [Flavobacteriales bacterium]|nr:toxin-antitoxin system YwqK family antitoxin [Flavobacteriales bacterium]